MDRVVRLAQLAPVVVHDQLGVEVVLLYALDSSGALWLDQADGDGFRRVEQPPETSETGYANTTKGRAR